MLVVFLVFLVLLILSIAEHWQTCLVLGNWTVVEYPRSSAHYLLYRWKSLISTKLKNCDKTGLNQENKLVDVVSIPFVNSHMDINHFKDSIDNVCFILLMCFYSMWETTLTQNPLLISKSSVRLANNFVRWQLRDNLLSVDQV